MALSEASQITICQILNPVMMYQLTAQIAWLGSRLTTAVQTAIETEIALWSAGAGTKTTRLEPKESNKGVRTNPDDARQSIRKNIAVLLERPDWAGSGAYLDRG